MQTGRPKIEWSEKEWSQFDGLCEIQCTAAEVCAVMGICEETLNRLCAEKHKVTFSEYIKSASACGKRSLRRLQWDAAEKGNATMLVWLGKQYLGQTDKIEAQNTNLNAEIALTDEQVDRILQEEND